MRTQSYLRGSFGLKGKVALVTGGRQGIGKAISLGLAHAGASIAVTSRDVSQLHELCQEISALGVTALPLELELRDAKRIDEVVGETLNTFGRLDIVINNAALALHGDPLTYHTDDWDNLFLVNLRGAFLTSRAAARSMIAQQSGRIINVSSPFARVGVTGRFAYSATKAGLEQLTRSLAVDWAASGITVNSVVPATVLTETRAEAFAEDQTRRARITQIPLGRLGRAEDIVGPVLLLAGPAGEFITGQTIVADGGYTTVRF